MLYTPKTTSSPLLLIIIFLFIIIHRKWGHKWREASWERKRELETMVVVIITMILLPLHFWGMYNLAGIESGGLFVEGFGEFSLGPGDTYTSWTLSNRLVVETRILFLYVNGGDVTFYFCDENSPEVHHREDVYSIGNHEIFIGLLPYIYTEPFTPAKWTLNFYNPSQNTSAYGFLEISHFQYDWPFEESFIDAVFIFQAPTIALFSVWIGWGVITLATYENKKRSLRPKIEHGDNKEYQEMEDIETQEGHE